MKTPENSKCNRCLHSRLIESENGTHAICTLPAKQAALCVAGLKDKSLYLEEWKTMKTPWEIKRSLFCCSEGECHKCYYERECEGRKMAETLLPDVMDYVKQIERERDAALYDMHQLQGALCAYCKNLYRPNDALQVTCSVFGDGYGDSADSPLICGSFKWRGVCPENTERKNKL